MSHYDTLGVSKDATPYHSRMRLLLTIALVALALALVPVTPAGALAVGFLAYRCGTDVRAEQALLTALAIAGGLGVLYTLAKGIWPSLP